MSASDAEQMRAFLNYKVLKKETKVRNRTWTLHKGHSGMKMALYGGKGVDMLSC